MMFQVISKYLRCHTLCTVSPPPPRISVRTNANFVLVKIYWFVFQPSVREERLVELVEEQTINQRQLQQELTTMKASYLLILIYLCVVHPVQ